MDMAGPEQISKTTSCPFHAKARVLEGAGASWKTSVVDIFQTLSGVSCQIGSYARNHYGWSETTFFPFQLEGRWYALYSCDYTATRVMELPSCRDIAGENASPGGFCPVDYYVPYAHEKVIAAGHAGKFGFVAGCIWGDDSSWKIQYLGLSEIANGVLVRQERFGYVAMPNAIERLSACISLDGYEPPDYVVVDMKVDVRFDVLTGLIRDTF